MSTKQPTIKEQMDIVRVKKMLRNTGVDPAKLITRLLTDPGRVQQVEIAAMMCETTQEIATLTGITERSVYRIKKEQNIDV